MTAAAPPTQGFSPCAAAAYSVELAQRFWTAPPPVRAYLHEMATGDPNCDWITAALARYAPPRAATMVLGCGNGWLERGLASHPRIGGLAAGDSDAGLRRRAAARARARGLAIVYFPFDPERPQLPPGEFDLVFAVSLFHHVFRLEELFAAIHRALRPGGLLLVQDYVGPRRFQYSATVAAHVDRLFALLPEPLRQHAVTLKTLRRQAPPDSEELQRNAPAEAARSDEISALLGERFEIVERRPYGGTLLAPLLFGIGQNFMRAGERADAIARLLCLYERRMLAAAVLPADYAVIVARRSAG